MYICYNKLGDFMEYTSFPTRLKIKTDNPILDFYRKCLKSLNKEVELANFDVTKVYINPKDSVILRKALISHIKHTEKKLPSKMLKAQVELFLLQFGPAEKNSVPSGIVFIDFENLYVKESE